MKKIIHILLIILTTLLITACQDKADIIFNVDQNHSITAKVGDSSIDISSITAIDHEGTDITEFIEYEGNYDLDVVGTYQLTVFVYDNYGNRKDVQVILIVEPLSCEEDPNQESCLIAVEDIELSEASSNVTNVYVGGFIRLTWTITPQTASNQNVTLSTSDEDIASVSDYGFVFGHQSGEVTITITTIDGNFSISKTLNVIEKTCEQDPNQEKCYAEILNDDSRVVTLPESNISNTDYGLIYVNEKVYYQIYVRSFHDTNNNQIGDLNGITAALPYLKTLGIQGIWLMPIMQSRADHGYEIDDYFSIDNEYGTMDDFINLVSEAKALGIDIIIDLVINHMGAFNNIFQDVLKNGVESDYFDWFTWINSADPRFDTKGSWGQTIWWNPTNRSHLKKSSFTIHSSLNNLYYNGYFSDWMPDLNFLNPDVIEYIYDVGRFWLEHTGVSGFRMDAVSHIYGHNEYLDITDTHQKNIDFLSDFSYEMQQTYANVFIVGEAWENYHTYSRYFEADISAFNFELSYKIEDAVKGQLANQFSNQIELIYNRIKQFDTNFIDAPFLRNHDQARIASSITDQKSLRLATEILLTLPGSPFIYYGDEIGMLGQRTPMVWGDYYTGMQTNYADRDVMSVGEQINTSDSLLTTHINIINTRNNSLALMHGDFYSTSFANLDGYYRVFNHNGDKEIVIVLTNFSSVYTRAIPDIYTEYEILYHSYENNIGGISPKGMVILKLPVEMIDTLNFN